MANPAVQRARFLAPGDKLGKHDLIRQIAVGGMAELYLARTMGIEGFEKLVVVKRILPQYLGNASFVNMFLNEARLAATLHHPNIAQVYDIGQDGGEFFFSMEYVHGEDLGRMLRNAHESGVPVSLDAALTLAAGLCAGLHHAHEKTGPDGRPLNVVHRDVSPSNVLVSYDGAVKLVDFGIARVASTPGSTAGGLKGKISYMSPEQCKGKTALDRRSDIFSVGTILYELTTGQLPFTDETEYAILNHIVNTDAAPPSKLVPGYPPALEAIVMRALARDPEARYRTALDLQGDLEDFAHENRLRVSPLVLARLMSTLFPARLEEWANAKQQGAFFVEQHVVRTLIENSQVDAPPLPDDDRQATQLPSVAGEVSPPPDEDATAVTAPPIAPEDVPTALRAPISQRPPTPVPHRPTPPPPRQSTPLPQMPAPTPPPNRQTPMPRATSNPAMRTQVGVPAAPPVDELVQPVPTPRPARAASPVPGMPGAVPIVAMAPPQPGTLVSNPAVVSSNVGELTMRVRVPTTTRRSKKPALVLALLGLLGAAGITFFVLSRGDDKLDSIGDRPAVAPKPEPKAEPKAEPIPTPADESKAEPVADPKPVVEPPSEQPEDPKPAVAKEPEKDPEPEIEAPPKKPTPKIATTPKKPATRSAVRPVEKKEPKPEPKPEPKETQWKGGDSPFMPVRPADKK